MRLLPPLSLLVLATTAAAGSPKADWKAWADKRDAELADPASSYLAICELAQLKEGEAIYLLPGAKHGAAQWSRAEPAVKPYYKLSFAELAAAPHRWDAPGGGLFVTSTPAAPGQLVLGARDPLHPALVEYLRATRELRFGFDASAVVKARIDWLAQPVSTRVETTRGQSRELWRVGTLRFKYRGTEATLDAFTFTASPAKTELFIPFKDASTGAETYAGGRYLEAELGEARARDVTLDFNRAFNPLCARNPVYNCLKVAPAPLPFKLLAGEKAPPKH